MVFRKSNQSINENDSTSDDIDEFESYIFDDDFNTNYFSETHQNEKLFFDFNTNKQKLIQDINNDDIHVSLFENKLQEFDTQNNINIIEQQQNKSVFPIRDETIQKPENKISTIQSFIEYLNLKINKDKKKKISKDILLYMYKHLKEQIKFESLTRDEKRIKMKLITKLYKYSNQIKKCFEMNPDVFLVPIIVYSVQKNNQKIIKSKRKKFLKKYFVKS